MKRRHRGKTILLCPSCGSPKISLVAGSIVGQVYRCARCGYVGSLVFETELPEGQSPPADG